MNEKNNISSHTVIWGKEGAARKGKARLSVWREFLVDHASIQIFSEHLESYQLDAARVFVERLPTEKAANVLINRGKYQGCFLTIRHGTLFPENNYLPAEAYSSGLLEAYCYVAMPVNGMLDQQLQDKIHRFLKHRGSKKLSEQVMHEVERRCTELPATHTALERDTMLSKLLPAIVVSLGHGRHPGVKTEDDRIWRLRLLDQKTHFQFTNDA